jgi:hypothetical protein
VVPAVYINKPLTLISDEEGMTLNISRAVFSNTATELFYELQMENGGQMPFGEGAQLPTMQLYQGVHLIQALGGNSPTETVFEERGMAVGKLTFAPVPLLNRNAQLVIKDLYHTYDLTRSRVDVERLFNYRENGTQTIRTGKYKLILEAMAIQNQNLVMVLYAEDEQGERIETMLDTTVSVEVNGELVEVAGKCYTGPPGCDVVYNLADAYSSFMSVPISEYKITINQAQYKIPELKVELDLTTVEEMPERFIGSAEPFVETAFLRRLAHKSGLLSQSEIGSFAAEILNDRTLARYYQPTGVDEMPKFNARVVSGVISAENTFVGVVEEEWMVGSGEDMTRMHLTHKVVCERRGGTWVVTGDELIS